MARLITSKLTELTKILLDQDNAPYSLRPEVIEIRDILASISANFHSNTNIAAGETRTSNGLAISPTMAAMCTDDYVRTIIFLRGLYASICEKRNLIQDRRVRVLYAGTGPYAILAIPLMTVLSDQEVVFELLDIHETSITSAHTIIETLNLSSHVSRFHQIDAYEYKAAKNAEPDIIIAEIMLAGLENEPQVPITRDLAAKHPEAIFLPQSIEIRAVLDEPRQELGTAFTFDKPMHHAATIDTDLLPANALNIPENTGKTGHIFLETTVKVFEDHILEPNQSGLTTRRRLNSDAKPGETLQLAYRMGASPGLIRLDET